MNEKLSTIETIGGWLSTLLLGKTKEIIVRMDEKISNLTGAISELKGDVKELKNAMAEVRADIAGLKVHTKYGTANSPMMPSEIGKKLLEECGFYETYPSLRPKLFARMEIKRMRTLYDYEKGAEMALQELEGDPLMDRLKEYAVSHPEESLGLIFKIASWMVRDDFAKEHPVNSTKKTTNT